MRKRRSRMFGVAGAAVVLACIAWMVMMGRMVMFGMRPSVVETLSTHDLERRLASSDPHVRQDAVRAAAVSPDELTSDQVRSLVDFAVGRGLRTNLSKVYF